MGDACKIVNFKNGAHVQENGIIRLADGRYIGRLDGISFEEVVELENIVPTESA